MGMGNGKDDFRPLLNTGGKSDASLATAKVPLSACAFNMWKIGNEILFLFAIFRWFSLHLQTSITENTGDS